MTDKLRRRWMHCVFLTALVFSVPFDLMGADTRSALMPEEFNIYVKISNISGFVENIKQSSFSRLLDDPEVRAFLGNPDYANLLPAIFEDQPDAGEFSRLFLEQLKLFNGEAILALVTDSTGTSAVRFLAEIDKENYEKSLEIDRKLAEIRSERIVFATEEFAGIKIIKTMVESETDTVTSWQTHVNDTIIESHNREWLEKTIIAMKDSSIKAPDSQPELEARISIDYIATALEEIWNSNQSKKQQRNGAGEKTGAAPEITAKNIMAAIGLEKSGELVFKLKPGKTELEKYTALESRPGEKGIWTLFETTHDNIEQTFPFIPENLYSWKSEALNLSRLWKNIPDILDSISPGMAAYFNMITPMLQGMIGIDLNNDILAHLDSRYSMFFQIAGDSPKTLVYWKLKDERALSASVSKLFSDQSPLRAGLDARFSMADFRGYNIYALEIKPAPEGLTVGIAIAEGNLLVGEIELVRSAVRSLASGVFADAGFLKSEAYANVRKRVPSGCYSYGYTDWSMFYRFHLADILKNAIIEARANSVADKTGDDDRIQSFIRGLDVSKMPDPDHVASFLGPAIYYSLITDKGMESKTIFLYPQGSNEKK